MLVRNPGRLKIAGNYRVNQPIENFKLRVRIVQQKSLLAELFESEAETRDSNFLESEGRTFSWQEKVLSPFEVNLYKEERNCIIEIHKKYREKIQKDEIESSRLFSYTEDDSYFRQATPVTKEGYKSYLSLKNETALPAIRNRKPFSERYNKKIIESTPSTNTIRSNHYLYRDKRTMYIMADLTSKDEALGSSEDSETLLCTITYNEAGKILTIDPDFNDDECYKAHATGMSYDFWIEHASEGQTEDEVQMQRELLHHEFHEKLLYKEAEMFSEMHLPPPHVLRVYLTLDITKAKGFPYDALFLTYLIDLPKYWSTNDGDKLSGRTQRCRMMNGSANFSFVVEMTLDFDLNCLDDENVRPAWPQVLIAAASLDKWTRYRIEGYASQPLPPSPGKFTYELTTWRPVAGFINTLRRFFTGGTAELEDLTYSGIPQGENGPIINKSQLKVVPGGFIDLQMNIVQQCRDFSKNPRISRVTLDRLSAGTLINNVNNVLEQFKAARERMIRARAMCS
ncbi:Meckel syndrome type 1 protein [Fopius arisanus]|uniref:Meckel syndrome type 1 protein n=1 Tax=Fopius arisanus TaxID=64838 RepID=A0A9R1U9V4_9HYME|nr:PREDICTED: Meckel syndrome type 1 protein [Fopius arisanus]